MATTARSRLALAAALAGAALLGACASTDVQPDSLAPVASPEAVASPSDPGYQAVRVTDVTGGGGTSFWTGPDIASTEFKTALETALQSHKLFSADAPRYEVAAQIKLDKPMMGIELTTSSTVGYTVKSAQDGRVVFQESITAPGTAQFGDAFLGSERLRIANERSVRENIRRFIARLRSALAEQGAATQS